MLTVALAALAYFVVDHVIRGYLDASGVPKGMTRGLLIFSPHRAALNPSQCTPPPVLGIRLLVSPNRRLLNASPTTGPGPKAGLP